MYFSFNTAEIALFAQKNQTKCIIHKKKDLSLHVYLISLLNKSIK